MFKRSGIAHQICSAGNEPRLLQPQVHQQSTTTQHSKETLLSPPFYPRMNAILLKQFKVASIDLPASHVLSISSIRTRQLRRRRRSSSCCTI